MRSPSSFSRKARRSARTFSLAPSSIRWASTASSPIGKRRARRSKREVTEDRFLVLGPQGDISLPAILMPPLMNNHGNYIVSLGAVTRWLGEQAAELGVEIYPGFAAAEVLYDDKGAVVGVATGDMGVGTRRPAQGQLRARHGTARQIHASSPKACADHSPSSSSPSSASTPNAEPQKYGIGLKELWEVAPGKHHPGPRPAFVRLAARQPHRRRLLPLSLRRKPRLGRLRRAPELREPLPLALRRIPALQDPPRHSRNLRRRQAHRLWRPRHHRRRLAVAAQARVPRRRAARLLRRLRQRAAHQGQPQRHAVGHRGRRSRIRSPRRRSRP